VERLDERIIDYLEIKGFQNSLKISKELKMPNCTVYRHIKKLIDQNIIRVIVHTNPVILGFKYWIRAGIDTQSGENDKVIDFLVKHPSVYTISEVVSGFNILIGARFKTEDAFIKFTSVDLPALEGIRKSEVYLITQPRKYFQFYWPSGDQTGSPKRRKIVTTETLYNLDKIDRKILSIITIKGPRSATHLSKELGIGPATIQQHLKRMSDKHVFTNLVRVNPELGDSEYLVTLGLCVSGRPSQLVLEDVMKEENYFDTASLCVGRFNIMLLGHFHSIESLNEMVNVKLRNIPGVSSIETFVHTKRLKYYTSQY
jgi:Lrp/AsnC family transcriptional regulator, regulator for asnA, asnC and gidA